MSCLMCASPALQNKPYAVRKCVYMSPYRLFLEKMSISPILLGKLYENPIAIKAIVIKTTTSKCLWANPVCESHCSGFGEQYTCLNCRLFRMIKMTIGTTETPGSSLSQQYVMQSACHTHSILRYPQYWIFGRSIFVQLSFLHLLFNGFVISGCD